MQLDTQEIQEILAGVSSVAAGLGIYESPTIRRRMKQLVLRLSHLDPEHKRQPTANSAGLYGAIMREILMERQRWQDAQKVTITPAGQEEISWIAEFEFRNYGADAIPLAILNDWYNAFPVGFWLFRLPDGRRFGHIDLLPLKDRTLALFRKGKIIERQILSDALYSEAERDKIVSLYIESLAIDCEYRSVGLRALLLQLKSILNSVCDVNRLHSLYAIAASDEGLHFMTELRFSTISRPEDRADKHPFLGISVQDLLSNLEARFGNGTTLVFTRNHLEQAV